MSRLNCYDIRVDREKNLPEYNKGFIIKACGESCRIMEKGAVCPEVLMKYVYQFMIIAGISFLGELLNQLLPLPVPGSVYGLLILFFCLLTKIIRLDQVEDVGGWLLSIMPICFIAVSASMMTVLKDVLGSLVQIFVIAVCLHPDNPYKILQIQRLITPATFRVPAPKLPC